RSGLLVPSVPFVPNAPVPLPPVGQECDALGSQGGITNPLAWLDPQYSYSGAAQIATGIGIANMAIGDEPGAFAAFAFAGLMDAQNSFFTPGWETGALQGANALFSGAYAEFGVGGLVASWGFSTFTNWYVGVIAPIFTSPSTQPLT